VEAQSPFSPRHPASKTYCPLVERMRAHYGCGKIDRKTFVPELKTAISRLKEHPFTLIGLADREKFHTGLLAHALRCSIDRDRGSAIDIVSELWGDHIAASQLQRAQKIEVFVEEGSVDLGIRVDGDVAYFAEMKLKTGLADHQLKKYKHKHPDACGVVLGLFSEETGHEDIASRKFPDIISSSFKMPPISDELDEAKQDSLILLRMWKDYLSALANVSGQFEKAGLGPIEGAERLKEDLRTLKLKGVFEAFRYRLILAEVQKRNCPGSAEIFNTHGNAGIHFKFDRDMPFGLQWQAGALKLFVEDPRFKNGVSSDLRDARLEQLAEKYVSHFGLAKRILLGRPGKFRSVTVDRWSIFEPCKERIEKIVDGLVYLGAL